MELRQIQYFLSIVNSGSFSAAAEEHFISQSSLSKVIMSLEKEMSVSLFDRSKRRVALTDAGEAFLKHARKVDADYKSMIMELDGYKSTADTFKIAAIPILSQYGLANLIAQFRDMHPYIHFDLEEIDGLNILPGLSDFRYDLAFTRHNYLDVNKYDHIEICKDKLLVVVSKKNKYVNRESISIKDLINDNFIIFDRVTDLHRLILDECGKNGFEPTIFYSSTRKVSVFSLVETNIGITLIPSKVYEYHRHPGIVGIPLEEEIECNVVLAYLREKQLSNAAKSFVDFLKRAVETGYFNQNLASH
jgi:LysR family transcriptional regulator, transcription activator of glutamate synthase operon